MLVVGAFVSGKPKVFEIAYPIFLDSFSCNSFLILHLIKASMVFLASLFSILSTINLDFFKIF